MGCWGVGIFDDDLALDIRDLYNDIIMKGYNDSIATATVMQLFKESVDSEDDCIIIFSALSCIQLSRSNLFTEIKERTIDLIDSNSGMSRWEEAGKSSYQKKRTELNKLKAILAQAQNVKTHTISEISVPEEYSKLLTFSVYQLSKNNETKYIGSTAFPEKRFRYMNFIEFEKGGILQRLFKRNDNKENEFWNWFSNNELEIYNSKNIEDRIINELSDKLKKINEGLAFEFSGISDDKRTIAISADGIRDVFPAVIKLTNVPKLLTKWIVVPFRQRIKKIDGMVINFGEFSLESNDIYFLHKRENSKISLDIYVGGIENITPPVVNTVFLMLDSAIGEYDVVTKLGSIEILPKSTLAQNVSVIPLSELAKLIDEMK